MIQTQTTSKCIISQTLHILSHYLGYVFLSCLNKFLSLNVVYLLINLKVGFVVENYKIIFKFIYVSMITN